MTELNIRTGSKDFSLNGAVEVSFNDTDWNFIERLWDVFHYLDAKQDYYIKKIDTIANRKEAFAFMRQLDEDMREKINEIFDKDICTPVFGHMNVFALTDGVPVWVELVFTIINQCDDAFTREQKAINPRVQKYITKWQGK